MGKWLVVYSSVTGNTKQIAEAMAAAAEDADLFAVQDAPEDLSAYEVVLAGYWLRRGAPDARMAAFLPKLHGKEVALFETHGAQLHSEHTITAFARAAYLLGPDCGVLGTFACQGRINPALIEMRKKAGPDDPHANTGENAARWASAATHPDTADLAAAQDFVRHMYKKLEVRRRYMQQEQKKHGGKPAADRKEIQ